MLKLLRKSILSLLTIYCCTIGYTNNVYGQYCTPSYYAQCNWYNMYINSFSTTGGSTNISSNNTGCSSSGGYTYYSTRVHTGVQGTVVNFSLQNTPCYQQTHRIWVDFNRDNDFTDPGEQVFSGNLGYGSTVNNSFTIPLTATPGLSRLRVRANPYWTTAPAPCGQVYYGECEDYDFVIVQACSTLFTQQPPASAFACENGPGTISLTASNGSAYQWQVFNNGVYVDLANGTNYADVNTNTLKLVNTPSSFAGNKYRCMVTPTCNSNTKNPSNEVILAMRPNIKLLSQSTKDTSCIGLSTILQYKANEPIVSSTWQISTGTTGGFIDISGAQFSTSDDSLLITNIPDTLNGAKIRCVFKGICGTITTADMNMFVTALPKVITPPQDAYVKNGATVPFEVVAAGVGTKYQWQAGVNGVFANINNNGVYSGVRTDRLQVIGASRAQNEFQFRAVISGSGNCASAGDVSNFAVMYVEPPASVQEMMNENSITIFPNPATGSEVMIKTDASISEYLSTYILTDKLGKTISVGNILTNGNTKVNLSKLSADVYFIQVMDKDNTVVKAIKFTKL